MISWEAPASLRQITSWLGSAMRVLPVAIVSCLCAVLLLGCIFPGSSSGRVSIRGSLELSTGEPLPDREVRFVLPAAYGLGGLDLVLGAPEDFGHQDHTFSVTTDQEGEFSLDLGDLIYHVNVWLLPPLGGFPRHPPAPFLIVHVPSFPGEYYAVQTHDGQFRVLIAGGTELPLAEAHLSELSASSESDSADGKPWTVGIIDLRFAPR